MKKKLGIVFLVLVMVLSMGLTGCSKKGQDANDDVNNKTNTEDNAGDSGTLNGGIGQSDDEGGIGDATDAGDATDSGTSRDSGNVTGDSNNADDSTGDALDQRKDDITRE